MSVSRLERDRMWPSGAESCLGSQQFFSKLRNSPHFCGTRRFSTVFTKSRHVFLYWSRWIQVKTSHSICQIQFNIILLATPRCYRCPGFPHRNPGCITTPLRVTSTCYLDAVWLLQQCLLRSTDREFSGAFVSVLPPLPVCQTQYIPQDRILEDPQPLVFTWRERPGFNPQQNIVHSSVQYFMLSGPRFWSEIV
jgi:hypothetical protein